MGTMIFVPFHDLYLSIAPVTKRERNREIRLCMAKYKFPEGAPTIFLPNKTIRKKLIQNMIIFVAVVFVDRDSGAFT